MLLHKRNGNSCLSMLSNQLEVITVSVRKSQCEQIEHLQHQIYDVTVSQTSSTWCTIRFRVTDMSHPYIMIYHSVHAQYVCWHNAWESQVLVDGNTICMVPKHDRDLIMLPKFRNTIVHYYCIVSAMPLLPELQRTLFRLMIKLTQPTEYCKHVPCGTNCDRVFLRDPAQKRSITGSIYSRYHSTPIP